MYEAAFARSELLATNRKKEKKERRRKERKIEEELSIAYGK
jgi:hypothetical protein